MRICVSTLQKKWEERLRLMVCLLLVMNGFALEKDQPAMRKVAFLVGASTYLSPAISALPVVENDVVDFAKVLVDYGFQENDIHKLMGEAASKAQVRAGFQKALIDHAGPADLALFYFSGHGSQVPDKNGDEADGMDESLLLWDSRTGEVGDLVDDELNEWLSQIRARQVVVILDACHASARGNSKGIAPSGQPSPTPKARPQLTDPDGAMLSEQRRLEGSQPFLVITAVRDNFDLAYSGIRHSVLTEALIEALRDKRKEPLTYSQLSYVVAGKTRKNGQVCDFAGPLEQSVFGVERLEMNWNWAVLEVDKQVLIQGPPAPGWGLDALVAFAKDKRAAGQRSLYRIVAMPNLTSAILEPLDTSTLLTKIKVGDQLELVEPARPQERLRLCLQTKKMDANLFHACLKEQFARFQWNPQLLLEWVTSEEASLTIDERDLEFSQGEASHGSEPKDEFIVNNPDNQTVFRCENTELGLNQLARFLALNYQQSYLRELFSGSNSGALKVGLVAQNPRMAKREEACWVLDEGCVFQLQVTNKDPQRKVLLTGLLLCSDGSISSLFSSGDKVFVEPGALLTLKPELRATVPFELADEIYLIGTDADALPPWGEMNLRPEDVSSDRKRDSWDNPFAGSKTVSVRKQIRQWSQLLGRIRIVTKRKGD